MKKLSFVFITVCFLISCTDKSEKFIGTWKNLKPRENGWNVRNQEIIIEKVGENFTVQASDWNDGAKTKLPASYNKEQDKLEISYGGLASVPILYDPNTKHILVQGEEYEKKEFITTNTTTETKVDNSPKIGDHYQGGIIFKIDGDNGLVAASKDQCVKCLWEGGNQSIQNPANFDAEGQKFNDWRMPTKEELDMLCQQKSVLDISKTYYWSSTPNYFDQKFAEDLGYCWQTFYEGGVYKYNVRAIRNFSTTSSKDNGSIRNDSVVSKIDSSSYIDKPIKKIATIYPLKKYDNTTNAVEKRIIESHSLKEQNLSFAVGPRSGGRLSAEVFKNQKYARIEIQGINYEFEVHLSSATVKFTGSNFSIPETVVIHGNDLTQIKELMERVDKGTIIKFSEINVEHTSTGETRILKDVTYSLY